ncbi:MAG: FAD/NAD(P)-binding protein [Steroidobacteraceae bacterium]|jgi:uncharacterized NAD(P)/FAD-binding protein YdhS|nr:FAD/NAD(P)-binding protein [Steroidobacteraceae bacterium]
MDRTPLVAIVGSGFCGTVAAIHLLRNPALARLRILLIERPGHGVGGVAYDVASPNLVLNVPTLRMSAFDDAPDDFLEFLRTREPAAEPYGHARRCDYGEYLAARLDQAARAALERTGGTITVEPLAGRVRDLQRDALGRLHLVVDTGAATLEVLADAVLLATGPLPASPPAWLEPWMLDEHRYADAWTPGATAPDERGGTIVLLGTGLTMVDLAVELRSAGHAGPIVAVSRHGLLPRTDDGPVPPPRGDELPPEVAAALADEPAYARRARVAELARALHRRGRELRAEGRDWRTLIGAVRARLPELWHRLDAVERARFLRHARVYWDVHRHRLPATLAVRVEQEALGGQLEIVAGRVTHAGRDPGGLRLRVAPRGGGEPRELLAARVVNCTGAGPATRVSFGLPWLPLVERGWVATDAAALGVYTDPDGRLLDATLAAHPDLWYAGPLWRAQHWECTAVPELRGRLPRVAAAIATSIAAAASATRAARVAPA